MRDKYQDIEPGYRLCNTSEKFVLPLKSLIKKTL
jgi:hypothetical protein